MCKNLAGLVLLLTGEIMMKQLSTIRLVIFAEFPLCEAHPEFGDVISESKP